MTPLSIPAREVLRRSTVLYAGDLGFHVPIDIEVGPGVLSEIEGLVRRMRGPVNEAAQAVVASLLESEGIVHPEGTLTV